MKLLTLITAYFRLLGRGGGILSQGQAAQAFAVSASFVRDLVRRRRETGSVAPKAHAGGYPPALDEQGLERLAQAVADTPDATLEELA